MNSEARIFDGKADGKSGVEHFVFPIKTKFYGANEQLSGSRAGGLNDRLQVPVKSICMSNVAEVADSNPFTLDRNQIRSLQRPGPYLQQSAAPRSAWRGVNAVYEGEGPMSAEGVEKLAVRVIGKREEATGICGHSGFAASARGT